MTKSAHHTSTSVTMCTICLRFERTLYYHLQHFKTELYLHHTRHLYFLYLAQQTAIADLTEHFL